MGFGHLLCLKGMKKESKAQFAWNRDPFKAPTFAYWSCSQKTNNNFALKGGVLNQ
jgi:hypothetical protein